MKPWKKISILTTTLCLYIVIGGAVFIYMEQGASKAAQANLIDFIREFLANNSECGLGINATRRLLREVKKARVNSVMSVYGNQGGVMREIWSMQNGVVLCFSIVTTIGFGWVTPQTTGGQTFCIFYAIIGIPLEGYMLSVIGGIFQVFWLKCSSAFAKLVASIKSKRWRSFFGVVAILVTMWAIIIVIPAAIFMETENWSFLEAQYFNFVAVSTLGFGDLTPSHASLPRMYHSTLNEWLYRLGVMFYMFLGLGIISIVFVGVWRSQRETMKRAVSSTRLLLKHYGVGKSSISQNVDEDA